MSALAAPGAVVMGYGAGKLSTGSLFTGAVLNFRKFMSALAAPGAVAMGYGGAVMGYGAGKLSTDGLFMGAVLNFREFMTDLAAPGAVAMGRGGAVMGYGAGELSTDGLFTGAVLNFRKFMSALAAPGAVVMGYGAGKLSTGSLFTGAVLNFREFMSALAAPGAVAAGFGGAVMGYGTRCGLQFFQPPLAVAQRDRAQYKCKSRDNCDHDKDADVDIYMKHCKQRNGCHCDNCTDSYADSAGGERMKVLLDRHSFVLPDKLGPSEVEHQLYIIDQKKRRNGQENHVDKHNWRHPVHNSDDCRYQSVYKGRTHRKRK